MPTKNNSSCFLSGRVKTNWLRVMVDMSKFDNDQNEESCECYAFLVQILKRF